MAMVTADVLRRGGSGFWDRVVLERVRKNGRHTCVCKIGMLRVLCDAGCAIYVFT